MLTILLKDKLIGSLFWISLDKGKDLNRTILLKDKLIGSLFWISLDKGKDLNRTK